MNNLEYLFAHDRERILRNLTMEEDPCYICPKYDVTNPDVCDSDGRCTEVMREWLLAEHVGDESCRQDADQPKRQESPDCESDSREKLKSDAYRLMCDTWNKGLVFAKRPYEDRPLDAVTWKFGDMLNLLNRQAAITERETEKKWSCFSDSAGGHITELTNQLESAHAKNRALKAHIAKMQEGRHGWHIKGKELQQQVDSLKRKLEAATDANTDYRDEWHRVCAERANLVREIGTLRAERDRYRELCGKLLDAADEMRRVRDAYDQFTEVD